MPNARGLDVVMFFHKKDMFHRCYMMLLCWCVQVLVSSHQEGSSGMLNELESELNFWREI